jgi:hypothetical protein
MERPDYTTPSWTRLFLEQSSFLTLEAVDSVSAVCALNSDQAAFVHERLEQLRTDLGREWLKLLLQRLIEEPLAGERRRN